jgi:WD40 repeat protein
MGNVTSISFTGDYTHFFCGTSQSNIYWVNATNLTPELRNTCHYERINDVAFPFNYSDVFATAAPNEIRIWNSKNRQELLRIQVPGLDCYSVSFMQDGKSIISGWSDGKIRAFLPQSGKLLYVINDAHNHGCTAVTATSDGERIISGGAEGEIRIWKITKQTQVMEASMKEHRSRVWSIQISKDNNQAVSASSDGSCIIWDLKSRTRLLCLFESTAFKQAILNVEEYQILTAGSDRKITYWEKYDGQIIRSVEGSQNELNTLDITAEGKHFISGGQDGRLRIWNYDEGICYFEGEGHSGSINKVKISPNQRTIITVGSEGAIFLWDMPESIVRDRV